jgi:alpha-2-macroglobulin
MKRERLMVILAALIVFGLIGIDALGDKAIPPNRAQCTKLMSDGNWKEAYQGLRGLVLDPKDDPKLVGDNLAKAVQCLQQLSRRDEIDALLEDTIKIHAENWRLLWAAARQYLSVQHRGVIIAGEFHRGNRRGSHKRVGSHERDRVRALQLMQQAIPLLKNETSRSEVGQFYLSLGRTLMGQRGFSGSWRLQYLSDLSKLPDYEEGGYYGRGRWGRGWGGQAPGAPVGEDGKPVFHHLPKSWQAAETDGQRWRWALVQAVETHANLDTQVRYHFADFLWNQFGVQTMRQYGGFFRGMTDDDDTKKDESSPFAVHSLGEDETIARLANGIKRFKLPDEFNFVKIFKDLSTKGHRDSHVRLANLFENRMQFPKAVNYWRQAGEMEHVTQVIGNWGEFEPIVTQPAGKGATVEYRFRNGKRVAFTAHAVKVKALLDDVKAYIKTKPKQLVWDKVGLENIGYRLVEKNQKKYLGEQAAAWDLNLKPRPKHFDKRITITTPLQKPGAYFLTARMADGNTCHIIIWVADTAIVTKPMNRQPWYFVADAVSGQPVAKANLEFFGYWNEYKREPGWRRGKQIMHTRNFAEFTDADGICMPGTDQMPNRYAWVVTATTDDGRFAYHGFTGAWYGRRRDAWYDQAKTFMITDRPVYRPEQTVKFKFWVNKARYDAEGKSPYAGKKFTIRLNDPKGEKVWDRQFTADDYGGFHGEYELKDEATLGVYHLRLANQPPHGGGSFRVEEYKKPEFEVTVEAPDEPVMLGEKITTKVVAKYYFGAPVVDAKCSYKVLRNRHSATWYPPMPWDWFYGPGYGWFVNDYTWYPGWRAWGCKRPTPWWHWQWQHREQPEVVAQGEAKIGADGTLEIMIDTAVAKAIHPDQDHRYEITAEITDKSRRTIVGTGQVLVARKPFKVTAWVNRGYFRIGDTVRAEFAARRLDGKPVKGSGELRLMKIRYDAKGVPTETEVQKWSLDTNAEGRALQQLKASAAGQYRLSYKVTDSKNHTIEGGYIFVVRGEGFDGKEFRFNDIEVVADKREYKPGDGIELMLNTDRADSFVLLFIRPVNGVYLKPKVLRLKGKSVVETIKVVKRDMPNFFVEALTVSGGKVHTQMREIIVPPEDRALQVTVEPSAKKYKPGEKAKVKIKVRDMTGEPVAVSAVVSIYDKSVEYISGGSNVPEIKEFFWKWRRHHRPQTRSSLDRGGGNLTPKGKKGMRYLGAFGHMVADTDQAREGQWEGADRESLGGNRRRGARKSGAPGDPRAPMRAMSAAKAEYGARDGGDNLAENKRSKEKNGIGGGAEPTAEPMVRTKFADTALWVAALETNQRGEAEVELTMPENLTTWKTRVWTMGSGARCGEGTAEVVTTKNLIVRLQAPRFFVQKDLVMLSANVHNYLETEKNVKVVLELGGKGLELVAPDAADALPNSKAMRTLVKVPAGGETRVNWTVRVTEPGEAVVTMKALTDEESDAMAMTFPVFVHGMLKTESFCGVIRPEKNSGELTIRVPKERRPDESRLEIRYSPTLAAAMVDALPYLAEYPYGCTEQSLNRFLPTVITQKTLQRMGLDLKAIGEKRTNLNAQEIGDDVERAKRWKRFDRNPVFDEAELVKMVKAGVEKLTSMQCGDGGWGWFSGWGERSWPHTTAVVVHGLQVAKSNDVALVPGVLDRGVAWLKRYQQREIQKLKNAPTKTRPWKEHADNLDALVYMVLVDADIDNVEMREFLFRDRNSLSVYAKAMVALAYHKKGHAEKRDMLKRNIEQFLVQDDENQTAYLKLPANNYWWRWYGSEIEADAYYLKLLVAVEPKSPVASRLVKYLLNNRKHATYWNSTRDTALVVEAFADYIKATGEDKPDMTVEVLVDGEPVKKVRITAKDLFTFDNKLVIVGRKLTSGEHKITLRKTGSGPLYWNAYLTNFTLEDPITKAGLEIKIRRKIYKLVEVEKKVHARGSRGQAVDQKVEKYERQLLENLATLKSGDLVEVELEIESKNDYEYILFEDMKAAGFEPVAVRSGYNGNDMGAYMELRDERVTFFVRWLARGKHSVSYRLRAEIPGKFSALPAKASAMYAPELKANSDEIKLKIVD